MTFKLHKHGAHHLAKSHAGNNGDGGSHSANEEGRATDLFYYLLPHFVSLFERIPTIEQHERVRRVCTGAKDHASEREYRTGIPVDIIFAYSSSHSFGNEKPPET
jgi:hypothetical protein